MKIKVALFDLDGTLLPMNQDEFVKVYFGSLTTKLDKFGYEPSAFIENLKAGVRAMAKNTGEMSNEKVFWKMFGEIYGEDKLKDKKIFDDFYENEYFEIKDICGFNEKAAKTVKEIKKRGYRTVLATNPLFPKNALESRVRWAGLEPEDFEYITGYENSSYGKPYPQYYLEIAKNLNVSPEECIMIGNDVRDDMVAGTIGMDVFLLTDCLINRENKDITKYKKGTFDDVLEVLK